MKTSTTTPQNEIPEQTIARLEKEVLDRDLKIDKPCFVVRPVVIQDDALPC